MIMFDFNTFQVDTLEISTQIQTWKIKMTFLSTSLPQDSGLNGKWKEGKLFIHTYLLDRI